MSETIRFFVYMITTNSGSLSVHDKKSTIKKEVRINSVVSY
ncbi:hypothetical protein [Alysiella crassa]|nr:hypothetical protein [Alysiella crassa]